MPITSLRWIIGRWLVVLGLAAAPAVADESPATALERCLARVAVSAIPSVRPLPRFVSLKFDEVNVRRGPARDQTIDWVFARKSLPVMVISEHKQWRQICDHEGATGWIHQSQLTGARSALVVHDRTILRMQRDRGSRPMAEAELGTVLRLERCTKDWCLTASGPHKGWVERSSLWGILETEGSASFSD